MKLENKYHRYYIPNSVVFITQCLADRTRDLLDPPTIELLLSTLRNTKALHPFSMLAYAYLPDHLHLLIRPHDGVTHSAIMHSCKSYFSYAYAREIAGTSSVRFWQARYYDHVIRSENDFEKHLDYIHYNPCKHGYVARPEEWRHSSYIPWCERNAYAIGWGWSLPDTMNQLRATSCSFGEP